MKIRIVKRPTVEEKHGVSVGREFDTVPGPEEKPGVWVDGDAGERVLLFGHEFEYLTDEKGAED